MNSTLRTTDYSDYRLRSSPLRPSSESAVRRRRSPRSRRQRHGGAVAEQADQRAGSRAHHELHRAREAPRRCRPRCRAAPSPARSCSASRSRGRRRSRTAAPGCRRNPPKPVETRRPAPAPAIAAMGITSVDHLPRAVAAAPASVHLRGGDDADGVGAEEQAEALGRHVEQLDEDERRPGDVGQQPREDQPAGEHPAHERAVAQQAPVGGQHHSDRLRAPRVAPAGSRAAASGPRPATTAP